MGTSTMLREQVANRCKHFTGIQNDSCSAGVVYLTVRDSSVKPYELPCIRRSCKTQCDKRVFPTDAEVDAEVASIDLAFAQAMQKLASGLCPHCGKESEPRRQVGPCVYGACGHRLYQGKL